MTMQHFLFSALGALFLLNASCAGASVSNIELSIQGRIEACRVALKDLEKLRQTTEPLDESELLDSIFFNASLLLKDIEENHSESELLLLIGQCQGLINSLEIVMGNKKYKGDRSRYGSAKGAQEMNPIKNQAVARPNGVKLEPMESLEDIELRRKAPLPEGKSADHVGVRQSSKHKFDNAPHDLDLPER